ncbi:MAG: hypothetical protein H0T87_08075 [Gammaproteobacteria bacterium]|nr:hypothetical protein [Gammaproteobacteria bacterium]
MIVSAVISKETYLSNGGRIMLEWHFILALLAAVAVIAFAILYVRDKRNASKDEPARDDHDDVKMDETGLSGQKTTHIERG